MLTLTTPLIYSEKILDKPPEINNFLFSIRDIVHPVVTANNVEQLVQEISKATPVYIALRESFIDAFKEGVPTQSDKDSESYQSFIGNVDKISKKPTREKLGEAFYRFISASQKILNAIDQTPPEKFSHFIKSKPGLTLLGKMIYTEFIFQCCRECLIAETVAPPIFQWLTDAFHSASQEIQGYVDSMLQAWDVLTDIVGMEAIHKSHEARKLTGKPVAGSRTVQEFVHELEG
jgi:hypothetical protein